MALTRNRHFASPLQRYRTSTPYLGALTIVVALAAWQLASKANLFPPSTVPSLFEAVRELGALVFTEEYWLAVWKTLSSALLGLALVVLIGTPMALIVGLSSFVRQSTWLLLEFIRPIPPVVVLPLALLLWGPTSKMKLVLIVFGALWPYFIQMVYGIGQIDPTVRMMSKSYRLTRWRTATQVILPGLLPFATTGLRVSASIAVIVSVVTELIGGAPGLGRSIVLAQSANSLSSVYALIVTAGLLGALINRGFVAVERPLLFWHPSYRQRER